MSRAQNFAVALGRLELSAARRIHWQYLAWRFRRQMRVLKKGLPWS